MSVHSIIIGGVTYDNVGKIDNEIEEVYYHDVTTLDGTAHRRVRYTKTHHTVQFFNLLDTKYNSLRNYVRSNKNTVIRCGIPNDSNGYAFNNYYISIIDGEINKGYLNNGNYYRTGLTLYLKKVNADE